MHLVRFGLVILSLIFIIFACSSKLSEEEYYNAAKDAYAKENYTQAVENFKNLVNHYPEGKRSAETLFMLGFINANDIKNLPEAEKYYKEFIAKYPQHELADDAQYELNTLGKDINDLPFFKTADKDSVEK